MADLNTPSARILLAKIEIQHDEQMLVIAGRDLRLAEIAEENVRVSADIDTTEARAVAFGVDLKKVPADSLDSRRLQIKVGEQRLAVKQKKLRLLELDEEHAQVLGDIEASRSHLVTLAAEKAQQIARLKEA